MENVRIKINTIQTIDEAGNEDVIEILTEATLEKSGNCFIINYDESTITENKGSRTRLKIYKNKMLGVHPYHQGCRFHPTPLALMD